MSGGSIKLCIGIGACCRQACLFNTLAALPPLTCTLMGLFLVTTASVSDARATSPLVSCAAPVPCILGLHMARPS